MKIEEIEGKKYITLEQNDKLIVKTDNPNSNGVMLSYYEHAINIDASVGSINKITGKGILEKVIIPPVLSAEQIAQKCDDWLKMFRGVHDLFRKLVLLPKCREQNITMDLEFGKNFLGGSTFRTINLDLVQSGTIIMKGMTISIDADDHAIYDYLLASTLSYYISKNYSGQKITLMNGSDWNLYSNEKEESGVDVPISASLHSLSVENKYRRLIRSLVACNNIGNSYEQILVNYRNEIDNQQLSDELDNGISHSANQCKFLRKKK